MNPLECGIGDNNLFSFFIATVFKIIMIVNSLLSYCRAFYILHQRLPVGYLHFYCIQFYF